VPRARTALFLACAAWLGLRAWAALRPTAFPYLGRPILDLPRPFITRSGLLEILEPAAGERILEVGPGTGYYTLPVGARLGPGGVLEILDVRQSFLDHTLERARKAGLANVLPRLGDGAHLPYPDDRFDAAYLITVLGELPDPQAALGELRRVLKPAGRLVVGEIFIDPDFPRLAWLVRCARAAGLMLERRTGTPVAYFARFRAERTWRR
jgi:ubiquinone/menaquinone biosynthesis C-methylase UbiE